jgi:SH3 domain-containing YSC84-like protein 1
MKTLFLVVLAAFITAAPLTAANSEFADQLRRVETCEAVLREFMADRNYAIPTPVLQRARALIVTRQFKAGFILGMKGGHGVVMVKKPDGRWSLPVLIRAGEASFGLQLGGSSVETIYVITDDNTPKLLFNGRFNVGADAKAVAGPKWAEVETVNKEILDTPVLVYSKQKGLYAGATLKAGYVSRDDESNRRFYNTPYTMPELLYGDFVKTPPEVQPLIDYVTQIAP